MTAIDAFHGLDDRSRGIAADEDRRQRGSRRFANEADRVDAGLFPAEVVIADHEVGPTSVGRDTVECVYADLTRSWLPVEIRATCSTSSLVYLDEACWLVAEVERVLGRPRGLRIGEAEDRYGQYFHYLAMWLFALGVLGRHVAGYTQKGVEIARDIHEAFVVWDRGVWWKETIVPERSPEPRHSIHRLLALEARMVRIRSSTYRPASSIFLRSRR